MTEPAPASLPPSVTDDMLIAASRWTLWRSLARGLAHSLANASQMLALTDPGPMAREEARERVSRAAAVLGQFGRPAGAPTPTLLDEVLADLAELQALQSAFPSTVLPVECPAGLPPIGTPASDLLHALLAIVTNAKEACAPQRAELALRVEATPDGISIVLCDAGPGWSAGALEHAFDAATQPREGHLGTGLAAARVLLRRSGGDVCVLAGNAGVELRVPAWRRAGA
jgi:C4-dicarboxylate-specific signal transduction histidine kinase